jgi:hypothetical protein
MVGIYDFSAGHGQCLRSSEFGHCIPQVDVPSSQSWFVLEISETTCGLLEKNQYQQNIRLTSNVRAGFGFTTSAYPELEGQHFLPSDTRQTLLLHPKIRN